MHEIVLEEFHIFLRAFRVMYNMEIAFSHNSLFQELVKTDRNLASFKDLLSRFLNEEFLPIYEKTNVRVEFTIFIDPDTAHEKPMVEISFSTVPHQSREELQHRFVSMLREFLAKNARNEEEFMMLREQQRKFMFIFNLE